MTLNDDSCYEALRSRDARFDGRFFTAVKTTGIYCRPVCPAPRPKRKNVLFFPCAAAAEEAGFRPCRRCRPETSPGTPAWLGTSATVSRALRLIHEGALDDGSLEDLADRLGIGGRHLRRLFREHLGASPAAVARIRRVHFARRLIDETDLPITDVAFASGFSSVRRFNEAFRRTYADSPRAIRSAGRSGRREKFVAGRITLRLPYREPYDVEGTLSYLERRATPGVEEVAGGVYRRSVRLGGGAGVIEARIEPGAGRLLLTIPSALSKDLVFVVERVKRIFDLGADPMLIDGRLGEDRLLRRRVERRPGIRVPGAWDGLELIVRAILGQQVTVAGATRTAGRIASDFGEPLPEPDGGIAILFPTAETLASVDLSKLGIVRGRARAIRETARAVLDGRLVLDGGEPAETVVPALLDIPGIGDWTASYAAMRFLREPDAFPAGDLGLRRALTAKGKMPAAREVESRAEPWRPWRAYAAMHLWAAGAAKEKR